MNDKRKQSLYFQEDTLQEIQAEAIRQDRSLSWVVQRAWALAREVTGEPWTALLAGIVFAFVPLLGSFITEPAAMTLAALMLRDRYYARGLSRRLMYATLGVLFVNVSIGGTLTPYAAPPVLMVAATCGWDLPFMLSTFGWKVPFPFPIRMLTVLVPVAVFAVTTSAFPSPFRSPTATE